MSLINEDGKFLINLAKEKNLCIGCAFETFLGGGIQTCIKMIKDGWIMKVIVYNIIF